MNHNTHDEHHQPDWPESASAAATVTGGEARSLRLSLNAVSVAVSDDDINTMSFTTLLSAQIAEW